MSEENKDKTATDTAGADTSAGEKTYSETAFKELVSQRDSLKKNQSELQSQFEELKAKLNKVEEDDLKRKGDLQSLLDNKEKEITETKKVLEEISEYKTKYIDLDKTVRENLLKQLPEELKEVAEDLSTIKLQKFVEINKSVTPGMDNGMSGKSKIKIEGKKWADFTSKDLEVIKSSDFDGYSKLYRDRYGRNPTN